MSQPPASSAGTGRPSQRPAALLYRERLTPPLTWWAVAVVLAIGTAIAVGAPFGLGAGLAAFVLVLAAAAAFLLTSTLTIEVDAKELRAGDAAIPHAVRGAPHGLDAETTRRLRGPDADPSAYTSARPYIPTAVAFEVTDSSDRTPYWVVSTRHPTELVEVLRRVSATSSPGPDGSDGSEGRAGGTAG